MNRWKDELKRAAIVPAPPGKRDFLRKLPPPRMPFHEFLFSQIAYIRKWIWGVSALAFAAAVWGLAFLPGSALWLVSGLTPLLALTIISESGRSEYYKMNELEMTTRFSLRSIVLARLCILGFANLLTLGLLLLLGSWHSALPPFAAGLYIITPFLLTTFTGLYIVRRVKGQEAIYICTGTAVGISLFSFLSHDIFPFIYQEQWLALWTIAALVLLIKNGKLCAAVIKQTEELAWN